MATPQLMSRRTFALLAASAVASPLMVACGQADDSDAPLVTRAPAAGAPAEEGGGTTTGDSPAAPGDTNAEDQTGNAPAGGEQAAAGGAPAITIEMPLLAWSVSEFTIPVGGTIHFINDGSGGLHNFAIDQYKSGEVLVEFPAPYDDNYTLPQDLAAGTYTFFCAVPGHRAAGMEGTMTVTEGQAAGVPPGGEQDAGGGVAAGQEAPAATGGAAPVEIAMPGLAWSVNEFTIPVGGTIHFINDGSGGVHNLAIDEYRNGAVLVDFPVGYDADYTLPEDLGPGTYTFFCAVPGHRPAGMEGKMTVQ